MANTDFDENGWRMDWPLHERETLNALATMESYRGKPQSYRTFARELRNRDWPTIRSSWHKMTRVAAANDIELDEAGIWTAYGIAAALSDLHDEIRFEFQDPRFSRAYVNAICNMMFDIPTTHAEIAHDGWGIPNAASEQPSAQGQERKHARIVCMISWNMRYPACQKPCLRIKRTPPPSTMSIEWRIIDMKRRITGSSH